MLIRFKVSNYLSFDDTQEFTTYSGRPRSKKDHLIGCGKQNLLKFSALYGANASGKSNLIDAMRLSQHIILNGQPGGIANNYFKIKSENKTKPTTFEYEIEISGNIYAYGFDIILSENKIVGEWLYQIHPGKCEECIYERQPTHDDETKRVVIGKKYLETNLKIHADGMETNTRTLFLKDINFDKDDLFRKFEILTPIKEVHRWFSQNLIINRAGASLSPNMPTYLAKSDNTFDDILINKIIPFLGLGISNVRVQEEKLEELPKYIPKEAIESIKQDCKNLTTLVSLGDGNIPVEIQASAIINKDYFLITINPATFEVTSLKRLILLHETAEAPENSLFAYGEESDGTRAVLNLMDILFAAANASDKVYVIDELDRGLHPLLSHRFVELFFELAKGKTQLITTTHETHLMDLNLLRQDEIWLISKQSNGASRLCSLDEYNVRFDKKLAKAYLSGLYGGIPLIETHSVIETEEAGM